MDHTKLPAFALCRELVTGFRESLERRGTWCAKSGRVESGVHTLEVHSDFGPASQDKDSNQDFVLAWVPSRSASNNGLEWAVGIADGVTSSYYAELAAELACWASLTSVVTEKCLGEERARHSFNSAGGALGEVSNLIASDSKRYQPEGEFTSTWGYTLREGLLLQTTLLLCWFESKRLHVAMVGDGGAVIEHRGNGGRHTETLAEVDLATNRVHALGPRNQTVAELDYYNELIIEDSYRLGLYTDGVGRGLHGIGNTLFCELNQGCSTGAGDNRAKSLIERWISNFGPMFMDNLTVGLVSHEQRRG